MIDLYSSILQVYLVKSREFKLVPSTRMELLPVFLPLACCNILSSMLQHWSYCHFADFFQCCDIQSPMLRHSIPLSPSLFVLHLFFFLSIPMLELSFAHKLPRKCVQNDNNTNKITKYWDLKIHIFLVLLILPHLNFASPREN